MKNELRDSSNNDQLPYAAISRQIDEDKITRIFHAKSLKDITSEERKKDASKPIYLFRYE